MVHIHISIGKKHEKGDAGIPFEIQYQKGIYISNGLNIYRMIQISGAVGFMFVSQFYKRRKQRRRREQSREVWFILLNQDGLVSENVWFS